MAVRLRVLNKLAKKLRAQRMARGAVELASSDVDFVFEKKVKDGRVISSAADPKEVQAYEQYDTHHLVEEFMLLANCSVAQKVLDSFPDSAVLRRHPPPKADGLAHLANILKAKGFDFKFGSNAELAASLNSCHKSDDPLFNRLLRTVTVQHMNQAVYFCTGEIRDEERRRHYALASQVYTHFTSPIRRYRSMYSLTQTSSYISNLPFRQSFSLPDMPTSSFIDYWQLL